MTSSSTDPAQQPQIESSTEMESMPSLLEDMDVDYPTDEHLDSRIPQIDNEDNNNINQETSVKGKTAKEMDKLAEKWMKNCIKAASLPTMVEIFEPIVPELIEDIKECHSQGEEYMMTEFKRLMTNIFEEKNLTEKQNTLDRLKKEAEERERVKAQLVPTPFQVTTGILYNAKKQELQRLEKLLEDITKENYDSMNKVKLEDEKKKAKEVEINKVFQEFHENVSIASSLIQEDLFNVLDELEMKRT